MKLTVEKLEALIKTVKEIHNGQLSILNDDDQKHVSDWLIQFQLQRDAYMFLVPKRLSDLNDDILSDPVLRDFIFTTSYQFGFRVACQEYGYEDLIETLVEGIMCFMAKDHSVSFMPKEMHDTLVLFTSKETLQAVLTANIWVLTLLLISIDMEGI